MPRWLGPLALTSETGLVAAVAATMLVVDAWFDIVTTGDGERLTLAIISATFAELPLAIICAWTAVNAERVRARAYQRLRLRWERAVVIAESLEPHNEGEIVKYYPPPRG